MSRHVFSEHQQEVLEARILSLLKTRPLYSKDLAKVLNVTISQAGWLCGILKQRGLIKASCLKRPAIWLLTANPPKRKVVPEVVSKSSPRRNNGVTADDLAWHAYWNLPRRERRLQQWQAEHL